MGISDIDYLNLHLRVTMDIIEVTYSQTGLNGANTTMIAPSNHFPHRQFGCQPFIGRHQWVGTIVPRCAGTFTDPFFDNCNRMPASPADRNLVTSIAV